jgi:hypothetical protein
MGAMQERQKMIHADQVIPLFLKACPEWASDLSEERKSWDNDEPGRFNEISVLARFIVNSYKVNSFTSFPMIFETLEMIIKDGDEEAKNLAIVGLIEDIQTNSSWHPFGYDVFTQWLGTESLKSWKHIDNIWNEKNCLADIIRNEIKQKTENR